MDRVVSGEDRRRRQDRTCSASCNIETIVESQKTKPKVRKVGVKEKDIRLRKVREENATR